jgi:hypothetical protein
VRNLLTIILSVLAVMALVLVAATFSGVLIWWLWPLVVPAVFPGAVASGLVVKDLSLANAILLSWLSSILFKASVTSGKK